MMRYFRIIFGDEEEPTNSNTEMTTVETIDNDIQPQEATRRFNYSRYATKKTMAQGLLDVALLMSNASQLKAIMDIGSRHNYYNVVFGIIICSIILQLITAILLLVLGTLKDETDSQQKTMNILNNVITVLILLITVANVFITAFGVQYKKPEKLI